MKITHIIEASATGTLSMATLLANAQATNGHSVEIIYSVRPETPTNFCELFKSKIRLTNIQMATVKEKITCIGLIRENLKRSAPDQIFMHSSFAGFLGRISSLKTLPNSRFFYIPHCISFMRKDIGRFKQILFIAFEWIAALKKADYVACSESERTTIAASIPFRKCHLIENAIDFSSVISPPDLDTTNRNRSVITVGQIRPQKGPDEFSEIARAVRKKDSSVEFIWVGDGDPATRRTMEHAGVKVVGWVPKHDVWEHLNKSSLYLSTARWEGMPVSLIEASFAGLPVIASSCAGNIDVVEHEKTGWIFRTTDEAVQHIFSALNDSQKASEKARMAFEIAQRRFNVERYLNDFENLN